MITFLWIDPCPNERLRLAQAELRESILKLALEPSVFPCGPAMEKFGDILKFAREHSHQGAFAWCNSDVILTANPYGAGPLDRVYGFHRREVPSGEICGGVDMYLIPNAIWDGLLSRDVPDLWCGASHIDWWLTRAAALAGKYEARTGFIDHRTHEESGASKQAGNPYYRHNVRAYNAWARRNGAATHERRICLPLLGETMSPLTDLARFVRRSR